MKKEKIIRNIIIFAIFAVISLTLSSCMLPKLYSFKIINDTELNFTKVGFSWGKMDDFIAIPPGEELHVERKYFWTIFNLFGPGSLSFAVREYEEDGTLKTNVYGGSIPRNRLSLDKLNVFRITKRDEYKYNPFKFHITEE